MTKKQCHGPCQRVLDRSQFQKRKYNPDGLCYACKDCENAYQKARRAKKYGKPPVAVQKAAGDDFEITEVSPEEDKKQPSPEEDKRKGEEDKRKADVERRLASDHEAVKPGDLAADYSAPNYDREKKQEYNEKMGQFGQFLRDSTPESTAKYISLVAENEKRWLGKRLGRSHAIGAARELLFLRQFEEVATRIQWPVYGPAPRKIHSFAKRMQTLTLSDLHIGANLPAYENPESFDFTTAGRRLASLALRTGEYKTQYRDVTSLNLCLNGDIFEGMLGWNDADNAPLAEQMVASGHFLFAIICHLAREFPVGVEIFCEPGNHGRNKLAHPGRATSSKWNSFETVLYKFLEKQCASLPNVKFHIPKMAALVIPLFDKRALMTHGDTELKLKSPSSSGGKASWDAAIAAVNAERRYCAEPIDILIAGHFHDPDVMFFKNSIGLANGALVPPNGHARTAGYAGVCGQFLFESVPGYAFGDSRFLRLDTAQDADSSLDAIVPPFKW